MNQVLLSALRHEFNNLVASCIMRWKREVDWHPVRHPDNSRGLAYGRGIRVLIQLKHSILNILGKFCEIRSKIFDFMSIYLTPCKSQVFFRVHFPGHTGGSFLFFSQILWDRKSWSMQEMLHDSALSKTQIFFPIHPSILFGLIENS